MSSCAVVLWNIFGGVARRVPSHELDCPTEDQDTSGTRARGVRRNRLSGDCFLDTPRNMLTFWLCCGATMCLAIATYLPPVFLTAFSEAFGGAEGLSEGKLGFVGSAIFAGFMAGIAITGPLADRWGAKGFVLGGLGCMCAGLVLLASAGNYWALLASVFLLGLGAGILEVVLSPIVAALQPHRRSTALNWLHSFYSIGAVCTVVFSWAAMRDDASWRFVALGVLAVPATLFLGFLGVRTPPMVEEDKDCEPVRSLVLHPFLLGALLLIALGGATEIGMTQWLPAYAELGLGYSPRSSAVALACFSAAMVVGRILAGYAVEYVGGVALILVCCVASVALILTGSFLPYAPVALAACIALGFTSCCFWPTVLGLAADRFPRGGASMYALLAAFGNMGCMIMPSVIGTVAERSALHWGIAASSLCPLAMILLLAAMGLRRGRAARSEA